MTLIRGRVYSILLEKQSSLEIVCYLSEQTVYLGETYRPETAWEFQTSNGEFELELTPNSLMSPTTSFYHVNIRNGSHVDRFKLVVPDLEVVSFYSLYDTSVELGDILYENDPRISLLLRDGNQDGVPDSLQQPLFEQLDSPSEDLDSVNTFFTTRRDYRSGSLRVFLNGVSLRQQDYLELGSRDYEVLIAPDSEDSVVTHYEWSVL